VDSVAGARSAEPDGVERLKAYLRARFGEGAATLRVTALAGDASTREYFRIRQGNGSWVAALYPDSFEPEESSYLTVHRLLAGWQLPVPEVLDCDGGRGVVLLADLGDCTLQRRLAVAAGPERDALYRLAIDSLVRMQRAAARSPQGDTCFALAFDVEKLAWELDFFVKHFLIAWRACQLSDANRRALADDFDWLCREIAAWPRVLCHRDFHSRNLMWQAGRLFWIDFQDARMGPVTYDIASLLRDSYVDLDEELVATLLDEFRLAIAPAESSGSFEQRFELTCIQRNLKALGTFGYQAAVRGRREYLEFVPRTLAHVRKNLRRHQRLAGAAAVLGRHLEECRP
jgi:aminoglycoside/choline kinase family phosphotransferase